MKVRSQKQGKKDHKKKKVVYRVKEKSKEVEKVEAEKIKHNVPPKKYQLSVYTARHNAIAPLTQSEDVMILPANFQAQSFQQLYQVTVSYLFAFGAIANRTQATELTNNTAFAGVSFMIDGIIKYAQGQEELGKVPYIHAIYANLLRQKEVKFRYGKLTYAPNILDQSYSSIMTLDNGDIWFNIPPDVSAQTILTATGVDIPGDSESYSNILSCFSRTECPMSAIVETSKVPYKYKKDPSCFARTYPYFGSSGVPGIGLYSDAELETWFKFPSFSKFVVYDKEDTVVSRIFKPQSGPPTLNLAFALTDTQFHEKHLQNSIPVVYKFLDLNEFFIYVTLWLARAWTMLTIPPQGVFYPAQLPYSKRDFMVVLRQAIMSQFAASQLQGQFVQPLSQAGGPYNFKPLVMDPATTPTPTYANFMLPSVLVENLSMLKQGSYCTKEQSRSNKVSLSPQRITYVPVWGFYADDEIPDIFVPMSGEQGFNLFQENNVLPNYTSITDLRMQNTSQKLNPNSQNCLNILSNWNEIVQSINSLTQVSTISSDVNYTGNLLIYTRVQQANVVDVAESGTLPNVSDPYNKFIRIPKPTNKSTIFNKTKDNKQEKVDKPIKATLVTNIFTQTILSIKPVPSEMSGNLFKLFVPSVRLDSTSQDDKLTQVAYQTYSGEVCSTPYTWGDVTNGQNMLSRCFQFAGDLVAAQFSPSNEQDTLVQAFQQLGKESWGADLFGQIASGLLGLVPIVGPALSGLIGAL